MKTVYVIVSCMVALLPRQGAAQAQTSEQDACGRSALASVGVSTEGVRPRSIRVSNDIELVQLSDRYALERLTGRAALDHLAGLQARHPEAFESALADIARHGWQGTSTVVVERTITPAGGRWRPMDDTEFSLAAYTESNAQAEITLWSSDDGNNNTWEGTIYVEIYSNGAAATYNGQIDVSATSYPWVWYRKEWERPPTHGGGVSFRRDGLRSPELLTTSPAVLSFLPGDLAVNVVPVSFYGWAICWRACVIAGCTTAAFGCLHSGPAWPGCWGAWCFGAEAGCAASCYVVN